MIKIQLGKQVVKSRQEIFFPTGCCKRINIRTSILSQAMGNKNGTETHIIQHPFIYRITGK